MSKKLMPDIDRFCMKLRFDEDTGCWTWTDRLDKDGYGAQFKVGSHTDGTRRSVRPHRFIYAALLEPIPSGLVIDHLCRNRACQNPFHLEPVTALVNHARGLRAISAFCTKGHLIAGENERPGSGQRCRLCHNAYHATYHRRTEHKHSKAYRARKGN